MNKISIENRNLEKKSHELRENGVIPGFIYGPSIKNTAIKATSKELKKATERTGEVYQIISGKELVFVKFGEVQKDPVTQELMHFSLVEMPQGVENEVEIPVNLRGTPVGVKKGGVLVVMKDEIMVNGKPRLIPDQVTANISDLDIGDKLTVDDLNIPKRVDAIEDESEVVAICKSSAKEVPALIEKSIVIKPELNQRKSISFFAQESNHYLVFQNNLQDFIIPGLDRILTPL